MITTPFFLTNLARFYSCMSKRRPAQSNAPGTSSTLSYQEALIDARAK